MLQKDDGDAAPFNDKIEISEHEIVPRILYICETGDGEYWKTLLNESAGLKHETNNLPNDSSSTSPIPLLPIRARIRALKCLIKLTRAEEDEQFSSSIKSRLDDLQLIERLERAGIAVGSEELKTCDKIELVRRFAHGHPRDPHVAEALADVCVTYGIESPLPWETVLKRCAQLGVDAALERSCCWIMKHNRLSHVAGGSTYVGAWMRILESAAVQSATMEGAVSLLLLLQKCQVISRLNVLNLAAKCVHVGRSDCAAAMSVYLDETKRENFLNELLSTSNLKDVLSSLKQLVHRGVFIAVPVSSYRCRTFLSINLSFVSGR